MKPNCHNCGAPFEITDRDLEFYKKIEVPPPTRCPSCRAKRRMAFWNHKRLFHKKDKRGGKDVFSTYSPNSDICIYEREYWLTDDWDPMNYGQEYDPNRTFLEQWRGLYITVPFPARFMVNVVNSDYSNNASDLKDCYLCFDCGNAENCAYAVTFADSKDSLDIYNCTHLELSYELSSSNTAYQCFFLLA